MVVRMSALRTRRTLLPRNIIILMFLVLISVREGHYIVRMKSVTEFAQLNA
jgi:hypothetical protein